MWVLTSIIIPICVTAVLMLLCYKWVHSIGKTEGIIECMARLSFDGEALVVICPYDMIDEEYTDRIKQFIINAKEEHEKSKINRRQSDERASCDSTAKGRKLECRRQTGAIEDIN